MAERTIQLIQVGYYLSRYGHDNPPTRLHVNSWQDAYRLFYDELNGGRKVEAFEHSLKNSRDTFDGYFEKTQREGWKSSDGSPIKLTGNSKKVYKEFSQLNEDEIWNVISPYCALEANESKIFDDLIAEDYANSNTNNTETEGGIKVRISKRIERNSALRSKALKLHGYNCQVCGFNFEERYGNWGAGFAEVHHLIPLSELEGRKTVTDPEKDLTILCANCHRMVHRKKGITLTLDELRNKLL